MSIAAGIATSIATLGLSAALFQNMFGMITFDDRFHQIAAVRPQVGRSHVIYCLSQYERGGDRIRSRKPGLVTTSIAGFLRKPALVAVISDFLFADAGTAIEDLSALNVVHDVFLLMIDARFAFDMPAVCAGGWRFVMRKPAQSASCRAVSCLASPHGSGNGE